MGPTDHPINGRFPEKTPPAPGPTPLFRQVFESPERLKAGLGS